MPATNSSKSPRILILSASVGAGHIRAAEAVELALRQAAPDATIQNLDVLSLASKAFKLVYADTYFKLVNKAPHLLGWIYDLTDEPPTPDRARNRLRLLVQRASLPKLEPLLLGKQGPWDAVVNTHFLPAEVIARLKRKAKPANYPQFTVVTDVDAHGLWVNDPTDHYFVATEDARLSLERFGVDKPRITVTGIPIHTRFTKPVPQATARTKHNLSTDRPVVLLLAGGFGLGPIEQLFENALRVTKPVHICVVAGKNAKLKASLEKIPIPPLHKATILGFTTDMDELMAAADLVVTKPGGLTTSEALARGAAIAVVNPIPGQESRNSDFLLENGAAVKIHHAAALTHKLEQLLEDPAKLARLRQNAKALGKPDAGARIASAVLQAIGHG